jgi:hypothetical protein
MSNIAQYSSSESPRAFLDAVYEHLEYYDGELLDTTTTPPQSNGNESEAWLEKGDWLALAKRINAEKVFFVENDPVIVFCQLQDKDEQSLLNIFRRTWCMARPQCLFVARPGELLVYSLNNHPVRNVALLRIVGKRKQEEG